MNVEVGCGARVREFGGRRYWYFWHYEREDGHSRRREDYIGRVDTIRSREELLRRMAAYHARAEREFARRRARVERMITSAVHTPTQRYDSPRTPVAVVRSARAVSA